MKIKELIYIFVFVVLGSTIVSAKPTAESFLIDIACSSNLFKKLNKVLPLEQRLARASLSFNEYRKINDQRDFYWIDIGSYLKHQIEKKGFSEKELLDFYNSENRFWREAYAVVEKIAKKCPNKVNELDRGFSTFDALLAIQTYFKRTNN